MKILLINSRFFLSAGPEKYMFGLMCLLKEHNHDVVVFSTKNSNNRKSDYEKYFVDPIGGEDKVFYREYKKDPKTICQVLGRQFYSFYVKKKLDKLIKDTRPDVALVLHHQNKLSPSVIAACKENNVPVVLRLSDFGLVCPEGHFFRKGKPCEECVQHSLARAVIHRCVKHSLSASLVKAYALEFQRFIGIYDKVDFIVAPAKFTMEKVHKILNGDRLKHIPTFLHKTEKYSETLGSYGLIVGRIEPIKGIMTSIKAFKDTGYTLKIVGNSSTGYDEELKRYILEHNISNVEFLGPKHGDELKDIYRKSRFVLITTECYENMPNVALEAMMFSKPIIASNIGSLKDIVKNNHNGLTYEPADIKALRVRINRLFSDDKLCIKLGKNSYDEVITKYDPEKHYGKLIKVFEEAIKNGKDS